APRGLATDGEGRDQEIVDGGAVVELLAELGGLGPQVGVRELLHRLLEPVDRFDLRLHPADGPLVGRAEDLLHGPGDHGAMLPWLAVGVAWAGNVVARRTRRNCGRNPNVNRRGGRLLPVVLRGKASG